jgi:hypothetical protein
MFGRADKTPHLAIGAVRRTTRRGANKRQALTVRKIRLK